MMIFQNGSLSLLKFFVVFDSLIVLYIEEVLLIIKKRGPHFLTVIFTTETDAFTCMALSTFFFLGEASAPEKPMFFFF